MSDPIPKLCPRSYNKTNVPNMLNNVKTLPYFRAEDRTLDAADCSNALTALELGSSADSIRFRASSTLEVVFNVKSYSKKTSCRASFNFSVVGDALAKELGAGDSVGDLVCVGVIVGMAEGVIVGDRVGAIVGLSEGACVGDIDHLSGLTI